MVRHATDFKQVSAQIIADHLGATLHGPDCPISGLSAFPPAATERVCFATGGVRTDDKINAQASCLVIASADRSQGLVEAGYSVFFVCDPRPESVHAVSCTPRHDAAGASTFRTA